MNSEQYLSNLAIKESIEVKLNKNPKSAKYKQLKNRLNYVIDKMNAYKLDNYPSNFTTELVEAIEKNFDTLYEVVEFGSHFYYNGRTYANIDFT